MEDKKPETVTVNLTVPMTKDFYEMLQGLARIVKLPVETILVNDLYSILTNYFSSGGYFESWIDWVVNEQSGIEWAKTDEVEKGLQAIQETLF